MHIVVDKWLHSLSNLQPPLNLYFIHIPNCSYMTPGDESRGGGTTYQEPGFRTIREVNLISLISYKKSLEPFSKNKVIDLP